MEHPLALGLEVVGISAVILGLGLIWMPLGIIAGGIILIIGAYGVIHDSTP